MEQSAFNTLIQNLYQLKNSFSSNELSNRLQVQNYFSLPFALIHEMSPLQAGLERQKGYFKMESNTGIVEMYLSDFITLAILPDNKTYYPFSNKSLVLVVDVPNYQLKLYLPRVSNYTQTMLIDCSNRNDAINSLKSLSGLLEKLKKMSSETQEQKLHQVLMLQLSAESQATKNYNHQQKKYEFCRTLVQQVNDLLLNNDEDFIDFISCKIAKHVGEKSINKIKEIIRKALDNQDEEMRYYFVPGKKKDFEKMLSEMPLFSSPCTLKPEKKTMGYIDSSHQLTSPDEENYNENSKTEVLIDDSKNDDLIPDEKNDGQQENSVAKGTINIDNKEAEPTVSNFFDLSSSDENNQKGDEYTDGQSFDD